MKKALLITAGLTTLPSILSQYTVSVGYCPSDFGSNGTSNGGPVAGGAGGGLGASSESISPTASGAGTAPAPGIGTTSGGTTAPSSSGPPLPSGGVISTTPGAFSTVTSPTGQVFDLLGYTTISISGNRLSEDRVSVKAANVLSTTYSNMTHEYCAVYCVGYTFWAIQNGVDCSCFDDPPTGDTIVSPATSIKCPGNQDESCGSSNLAIVYRLDPASPPATITPSLPVASPSSSSPSNPSTPAPPPSPSPSSGPVDGASTGGVSSPLSADIPISVVSSSGPPTSAGPSTAAFPTSSVGPPSDTIPSSDTATSTDTGISTGVIIPTVTGLPTDGSIPTDTGLSSGGAILTDTGIPTDGGVPTGTEVPTVVPSATDTGSPTTAVAPIDSGAPAVSGSSSGSGSAPAVPSNTEVYTPIVTPAVCPGDNGKSTQDILGVNYNINCERTINGSPLPAFHADDLDSCLQGCDMQSRCVAISFDLSNANSSTVANCAPYYAISSYTTVSSQANNHIAVISGDPYNAGEFQQNVCTDPNYGDNKDVTDSYGNTYHIRCGFTLGGATNLAPMAADSLFGCFSYCSLYVSCKGVIFTGDGPSSDPAVTNCQPVSAYTETDVVDLQRSLAYYVPAQPARRSLRWGILDRLLAN